MTFLIALGEGEGRRRKGEEEEEEEEKEGLRKTLICPALTTV